MKKNAKVGGLVYCLRTLYQVKEGKWRWEYSKNMNERDSVSGLRVKTQLPGLKTAQLELMRFPFPF